MSATFFEMLKYAATGRAAPSMTDFDKMRALAMAGGLSVQSITGVPPITFTGNGKPLVSWSMLGNGSQTGTPTHDAPIMPEFVGKQVGADWTIQISCGGQTTPVYLGQTQTVRRVRKLVLTGEEANWYYYENATSTVKFFYLVIIRTVGVNLNNLLNTHGFNMIEAAQQNGTIIIRVYAVSEGMGTVEEWKSYLSAQYAAGTPVTVWYVLAEPETAIVNEPLAKIGDYADELNSAIPVPTVKGQNTLTVDTDLQPSSLTITGNIKEV
jgi:hypothetical protein